MGERATRGWRIDVSPAPLHRRTLARVEACGTLGMRLFGDRQPERRVSRREAIETAREEKYLQRLSHVLAHGIPTHHMDGSPSRPARPTESEQRPPTPEQGAPSPEQKAANSEEFLEPVVPSVEDPFITLPGAQESALGEYSFGDIILLGDETLGLYNRFIPEKEYDVVYLLERDGSLSPQGIQLAAHGARTIGRLPAAMARRCFSQMAWDRDLIVFHLYEFSDVSRVPHPTATRNAEGKVVTKHMPSETPAAAREPASPLQRGRRFAVSFGDRSWEAIYWGHDEQGALVAHSTTGEWQLMHLDLKRFGGAIQFRELLSREELAEIERALLATSEREGEA